MKNFKQLALVCLLSCGIANADISLEISVKEGENIEQIATPVITDGGSVSISRDGQTVSIIATPIEDGVSIQVELDGHSEIPTKVVQWGECAEFSCEGIDCCLLVVAEQVEQQ